MAGLDLDLGEAAPQADDDARHAAVAHQQVGAEADDEHGQLRRDAAQEIGEVGRVGRREQHLRRAADAKPRDVGQRPDWQSAGRADRAVPAASSDARSAKLTAPLPRACGSAASQSGSACAHSVLLPAPRQTTMSPEAAKRRSIGTRSRSLSTVATLRWPVRADGLGQRHVVDAVDRQLSPAEYIGVTIDACRHP